MLLVVILTCGPASQIGFRLVSLHGLAEWLLSCMWSQLSSPDMILNVFLRLTSDHIVIKLSGCLGSWLKLAASSVSALFALSRYHGIRPCPAGCIITLYCWLHFCFLNGLYHSIGIAASGCSCYGFLKHCIFCFSKKPEYPAVSWAYLAKNSFPLCSHSKSG